ncbi:hypothetical protein BDV25DRAFT_121366 [Aspergillus avenaceus]|uniref:Uncharacterized protein n=1 Tax=Aspergillus avenaceus TaxID=36643 RepID=A0A5N6U694_ASPAV|nr:hypothetical protein BDV25DRAFT_121366 [Aspergillus avenaceus]
MSFRSLCSAYAIGTLHLKHQLDFLHVLFSPLGVSITQTTPRSPIFISRRLTAWRSAGSAGRSNPSLLGHHRYHLFYALIPFKYTAQCRIETQNRTQSFNNTGCQASIVENLFCIGSESFTSKAYQLLTQDLKTRLYEKDVVCCLEACPIL